MNIIGQRSLSNLPHLTGPLGPHKITKIRDHNTDPPLLLKPYISSRLTQTSASADSCFSNWKSMRFPGVINHAIRPWPFFRTGYYIFWYLADDWPLRRPGRCLVKLAWQIGWREIKFCRRSCITLQQTSLLVFSIRSTNPFYQPWPTHQYLSQLQEYSPLSNDASSTTKTTKVIGRWTSFLREAHHVQMLTASAG